MDYLDIYQEIKAKIDQYLSKFGQESAIDELLIQILATEEKRTGLKLKKVSNLPEIDGQYSSTNNIILINNDVSYKPRVLFTIFHELMHYFLENLFEHEYSLLLEYSYSLSREKQTQEIENICNYGAGIFLIPDSRLKISPTTLLKGEELESLVINENIVSLPAFICRLSFELSSPAIFVILKKGSIHKNYDTNLFRSEETGISTGTYIEYSFNTSSHDYPLKRFHILNSEHILNIDDFNSNKIYHSIEECYIPYSQTKKKIPAWVTGFHLSDSSRYVGILHTKKPNSISESQQTLF